MRYCDCGKVNYKSRKAARRAANHLKGGSRPYRCPETNEWHLTRAVDQSRNLIRYREKKRELEMEWR